MWQRLKTNELYSWSVVFVRTVLPADYQCTAPLDHITCQTVLCSTAIPHNFLTSHWH